MADANPMEPPGPRLGGLGAAGRVDYSRSPAASRASAFDANDLARTALLPANVQRIHMRCATGTPLSRPRPLTRLVASTWSPRSSSSPISNQYSSQTSFEVRPQVPKPLVSPVAPVEVERLDLELGRDELVHQGAERRNIAAAPGLAASPRRSPATRPTPAAPALRELGRSPRSCECGRSCRPAASRAG